MSAYLLEWRRYRRSFRRPLRTHHGIWSVREGIVVRLQNGDRQVGWGEIAPIPWFGSETIDQAIAYCQSLAGQIAEEQIAEIPNHLPACQFGLESALEALHGGNRASRRSSLSYSVLLSADAVLEAEQRSEQWDQSCISPLHPLTVTCRSQKARGDFESEHRWLGSPQKGVGASSSGINSSGVFPKSLTAIEKTFKSKIGVLEIDREMAQIDRLLQLLPQQSKLRLDANGGLTEAEAYRWLEWCDAKQFPLRDNRPARIEFIEQPLLPDRFLQMQQLRQQFQTPIALDESVATIDQLQGCYQQGWRGIFVVKPAIAGSPARLRQFCRDYQPDVVWSSALETAIGRRYIEQCLIPATELTQRAIGFGVDQWFADDWEQREADFLWLDLAEVKQ